MNHGATLRAGEVNVREGAWVSGLTGATQIAVLEDTRNQQAGTEFQVRTEISRPPKVDVWNSGFTSNQAMRAKWKSYSEFENAVLRGLFQSGF